MIEMMKEFNEWDVSDLDIDTESGMKEYKKKMNDRESYLDFLEDQLDTVKEEISLLKSKYHNLEKSKTITMGDGSEMESLKVNKIKTAKKINKLIKKHNEIVREILELRNES